MAQPTNSNVDELQQNSSLTETYKNQLSDYCRKHSEKNQKFKKEELKKESQVNARKQNKEAKSKRRSVIEGFERGKRVVEEVSDRTCIYVNPNRGIEACVDVGNIRLSHKISSQGLRNLFGKLTKGLHRYNPAQKSQTEEVIGITPTPVSQPKMQTFGITVEKLAAIAVIWYSVYKIVREIGPPCWNLISSRLGSTTTIASTTRPEVKFKSQQETATFLQNKEEQSNKESVYESPHQDTERRATVAVCIKCKLRFPFHLLSEKTIQENRAFVVATCNLPKYNLSAGIVGCVAGVDKENWMEVLFLPKEGPLCHFPWLEEAAQLWPFALLTNSVDDVKKSFDLKGAKESKDRREYVFDIKKEWTGVTA